MMKRMESGRNGGNGAVVTKSVLPSPPPFPSFLRYSSQKVGIRSAIGDTITNREIARYWELKRMAEEDHFNAAIEAAALREADKPPVNNYKLLEASLRDYEGKKKENKMFLYTEPSTEELSPDIKDWWTKSNYAYLNQPALDHVDIPEPSSYVLQFCY